jgi:hypothetical protein
LIESSEQSGSCPWEAASNAILGGIARGKRRLQFACRFRGPLRDEVCVQQALRLVECEQARAMRTMIEAGAIMTAKTFDDPELMKWIAIRVNWERIEAASE